MADQSDPGNDPFESLHSLEDQYYAEGHALGVADGSRAGRIEGRLFGMQKGFEKFSTMGALAGQCAVWEARMQREQSAVVKPDEAQDTQPAPVRDQLPPIPHTERLQKHIATLAALTEAASLDTRNTEEGVSDFDDRLKRAEGKAKIIASVVGQAQSGPVREGGGGSGPVARKRDAASNMEDFTLPGSMLSKK